MATTGERAESDFDGPTRAPRDVLARARSHERVAILRAARRADALPYFRELEGEAGPVIAMEGVERVMLGSNNYLGLTRHPSVKAAAFAALERYGTGLTGSRLLNGTTALHTELERALAEWLGAEDALVFTTGYQANVGLLGALLEPPDTIVCDSSVHASILDGAALAGARVRPFRHGRLDRFGGALERAARAGGGVLVAVEGVYSMEGDVPDLARLLELCRGAGARLLVDEAHAVGVLGPSGGGACEASGVGADVDLRTGTFSKALASCGGFVAGPSDAIDYLRTGARAFLFTAAGAPAAVGAALAAVCVARSREGVELRARLIDNARYLRAGLADLGLTSRPAPSETITPVLPVHVGDDWHTALMWKALYDAGVYVNAAMHPAVGRGRAMLRVSLMASHERAHLDRALTAFERASRACAP